MKFRPIPHRNKAGRPCGCTFYRPAPRISKTASKLEWLRNRPDMQTPEGQRLFNRLDRHTQSVGDKLDPLLPWLAREVKKGRIHHSDAGEIGHLYTKEPLGDPGHPGAYEKLNLMDRDLAHLADWYQSNHPSRRGVDLMQQTWPEVKQRVGEWDQHLKNQAEQARLQDLEGGEVVHRFPDDWTIRKLGPEHLDAEGDIMGHCIGSGGYDSAVANGDALMYSLRDPSHRPHTTMELDPTHFRHPGYHDPLSPQEAEQAFHDSGISAYTTPERARIVQIQGKSDAVPLPEYQSRFKDWFQTFPEEERPYWEAEEAATNPQELIDHPDRLDANYDDGYGGGYGPHGDYGVRVEQPVDYHEMLQNILNRENDRHRGGYSAHVDTDNLDAMYKAAVRRNEIPHFAEAIEPFGQEQQDDFDEWRMMNSEYSTSFPNGDEHYPLTPEDDEYPIPEGHYMHGEEIPDENAHEKLHYEDENSWVEQHPGMQMTNYLYRLINPHHGPGTPQETHPGDPDSSIIPYGYQNQLQEDPTAAYREHLPADGSWLDQRWVHPGQDQWLQSQTSPAPMRPTSHVRHKKSHPHITTGDPCYCPWGHQRLHGQEVYGATKEASKIDWLIDRQDKFSKTPEGQGALKYLKGLVNQSEKMDPLTPWLYRELKKGRLKLTDEGIERPNQVQTGLPLEHWADWFHSNSPTRRGVDIMQMSAEDMENKVAEWEEELQAKMEEERQMAQGEVVHRFPDDWTIRRLRPDELRDEGDAMGHCVSGYSRPVETGECGIFSLRDPENQPHVTTEMRPDRSRDDPKDVYPQGLDENGMVVPHKAHVWQIQGKSDNEPIDEYKDRMRQWFDSFDHQDKPTVPSNQEKTTVPQPVDLESLEFYNEPEEDQGYGGDDPYRLSPHQADDYGLYSDEEDDPFEYEGAPDWDKIVNNTLGKTYSGRGYSYDSNDAERVNALAHDGYSHGDLQEALAAQYPKWETQFYQDVYNPDSVLSPVEQWGKWDRGQAINGLRYGDRNISALQSGPTQEPLPSEQLRPEIHPEQGGLPLSTETGGGEMYARPSTRPYTDPSQGGHPWYAPLSKTAAKTPPIYYRFAFSPKGGVSLSDNDTTHPAWVPYHRDIATSSGEANLIHGYAYRIGDGWRLTSDEHKPVRDPHVIAQVVRALMEREGHQMPREAAWTPDDWDWGRTHYGLPAKR